LSALLLEFREGLEPLQTAIFLVVAAEAAVNMTPEYQNLLSGRGLSKDDYLQRSIALMLQGIASSNLKK
jgi:hypothetical protein